LLPASFTKEQIGGSPSIATDKPVSRQHEMNYLGHPYYWGRGYLGRMYVPKRITDRRRNGPASDRPVAHHAVRAQSTGAQHQYDDLDRRSWDALDGYHIHASDGDVGHIHGLLVDEDNWSIRYLVRY
jgi:hypothetical protein